MCHKKVTDRYEGSIIKCKEEGVIRIYFTNERPDGKCLLSQGL